MMLHALDMNEADFSLYQDISQIGKSVRMSKKNMKKGADMSSANTIPRYDLSKDSNAQLNIRILRALAYLFGVLANMRCVQVKLHETWLEEKDYSKAALSVYITAVHEYLVGVGYSHWQVFCLLPLVTNQFCSIQYAAANEAGKLENVLELLGKPTAMEKVTIDASIMQS